MTLLRRELGTTLRRHREQQRRTLREVAGAAGVSLGYLSEVERGVKEASSELLSAICRALDVRLSAVLVEVADALVRAEIATGERPVLPTVVLPPRVPVGTSPGGREARAAA